MEPDVADDVPRDAARAGAAWPTPSGHREAEPERAGVSRPAELAAAEEVAAEQVTAVLTGVLDRLGAAHHRPFSRS